MSTQSDRRRNAIDVMRSLSGGSYDPERAANAMVRRNGALGSFGLDHILGTIWARPQLSRRDRSLIVIAFLASIGAQDELDVHIRGGIAHGLSREEIEEIICQVAGYAGFPMAMHASRIVQSVWCDLDGVERQDAKPEAALKDDPQRLADAHDVRSTLFAGRNNPDPAADRQGLIGAIGDVGAMAFDFAFGELWARDVLSRRDRSLVTIAILGILRCTGELRVHIFGALNHGCTREEVAEVMVQLSGYGGFPKAVEGIRTAQAVFDRIDERQ